MSINSLNGVERALGNIYDHILNGNHIIIELSSIEKQTIKDNLVVYFDSKYVSYEFFKITDYNSFKETFKNDFKDLKIKILESSTITDYKKIIHSVNEFDELSQNTPKFERQNLVILKDFDDKYLNLNKSNTLFKYFKWDNIISKFDMIYFIDELLYNKINNTNKRNLISNIIANYSCWDFQLAKKFISQKNLKDIVYPDSILIKYANSYGWTKDTTENFYNGNIKIWNGNKHIHSSYLLITDRYEEIRRRLWMAQVTVIYPLIEEHRIKIINKIKNWFDIYPFIKKEINDYYDIEIGHLCDIVKRINIKDKNLLTFLIFLKNLRNNLSHLKPISINNLLDDRLYKHYIS